MNDSVTGDSTLGMLDANAPSGYDTIYTSPSGDDFFGEISVDGTSLRAGRSISIRVLVMRTALPPLKWRRARNAGIASGRGGRGAGRGRWRRG